MELEPKAIAIQAAVEVESVVFVTLKFFSARIDFLLEFDEIITHA